MGDGDILILIFSGSILRGQDCSAINWERCLSGPLGTAGSTTWAAWHLDFLFYGLLLLVLFKRLHLSLEIHLSHSYPRRPTTLEKLRYENKYEGTAKNQTFSNTRRPSRISYREMAGMSLRSLSLLGSKEMRVRRSRLYRICPGVSRTHNGPPPDITT
ncbi:hypothetical protein EVAR_83947_1 [Eumeta japonica]|uniref:Uncharacterized protein n=1 Tax=Eumeta variegata TaxID=151549 RepID=A0A4C1VPG8_EUMVA|nr:hypothetical protein EVAR_83947_1 [Eumeta japonica]